MATRLPPMLDHSIVEGATAVNIQIVLGVRCSFVSCLRQFLGIRFLERIKNHS